MASGSTDALFNGVVTSSKGSGDLMRGGRKEEGLWWGGGAALRRNDSYTRAQKASIKTAKKCGCCASDCCEITRKISDVTTKKK